MSGELIYSLIPKVMADIGAVAKNRENQQQKYNFRGIEDLYNAVHPALHAHGVFCVPVIVRHNFTTFEKSGFEGKTTLWRHVTIKVRHQFFAPDGSHVDVVTMGEGLDNSDKATNKAMSAAMKYALIELFSVPTADIDDADRTTPEVSKPARTTKPIPVSSPVTKTAPAVQGKPVKAVEAQGGGVPDPPPLLRQPGEDDGDESPALVDALTRSIAKAVVGFDKPKVETKPKAETIATNPGMIANFAKAFREALPPHRQKDQNELRHEWLALHFFADKDGNPSSASIPVAEFEKWKALACQWARDQK
jgi:hypothetical protein